MLMIIKMIVNDLFFPTDVSLINSPSSPIVWYFINVQYIPDILQKYCYIF